MRKLLSILVYSGLLILLFSCSGSPPVIINTEWMLVYTQDFNRGGVYSELNFFAQLEDSDGIEDISEISIHKDELGWAWNLNPENWASYSQDGEDWLGSNGLTRGGTIPVGDYRLLIVDRSGQRNETVFRIEIPELEFSDIEFPSLKVLDDRLWISTGEREPVVLWFYNDKGILIAEKYTASGLFQFSEILSPEEMQIASWVMIYYQDEAGGYGLKSGPFLLNPEKETEIAAESGDINP